MNVILANKYTAKEILGALRSMGPTKAPGIHGFPTLFFQQFWHIMGDEVTDFYLRVLNENADISKVNTTNIILLPKVPNPTNMTKFHPISLCNILYKIIYKTVANRF